MLVGQDEESMTVPLMVDPGAIGLSWNNERYLGVLAGHHCYIAETSGKDVWPPDMGFYGLRYLYGRLSDTLFAAAMKAVHLLEWEKSARYCGRCGAEMAPAKEEIARECPGCGMLVFPRLSPAVIVLVERDGQILLARSHRFTSDFYSVLAGFVEPGETLEDTVHREIEEEVGIKVKNVRYFGSQPWPFPDSLMIGFTAEYESGEINIDKTEIADAEWFAPEKLPTVPGKMSIARELIDWFMERTLRGKTPEEPPAERRYTPGD